MTAHIYSWTDGYLAVRYRAFEIRGLIAEIDRVDLVDTGATVTTRSERQWIERRCRVRDVKRATRTVRPSRKEVERSCTCHLSDGEIAELWTQAIKEAMPFRFDPNRGKELYGGIGPEKPVTVVIDVDSENAYRAERYTWHDKQTVQRQRDGSVRVTFKCDDYAPLLPWILRLGSHAKVIKPAALVEVVVQQISATADMYHRPRKRS